jgi:hypothetical protein
LLCDGIIDWNQIVGPKIAVRPQQHPIDVGREGPKKINKYQNMSKIITRRIVLPLLTKALYEFVCFEGSFQKAKLALLFFY